MAKYNRPNGKLFGSSASNIGVFGSGQQNETPTTSTDPNAINSLGTHWADGWNGAVVSQAPYTAPYVEDMNAVNYVNSYNSAYLLQRGIAEYSATEEYQKDSLCTYNGEIWMCKLDNTVGQTPAEGTYWHLQGEVPIMNDNEILVGAVGGTPTVVSTDNQGDVLASASGLEIKSNTIVNADINSSAAIDESKLNLDYGTSGLNSTITGHIGNTSNPHSVTKAQVLTGDLIVNSDVDSLAAIDESKLNLDYSTDSLNTAITNHTSDLNNPHETEIANLKNVEISNLQDGDIVAYDSGSGKYINKQPAGGALSTLADTTITTPIADKSLVQYNLNDTKWENSTEVWDTIGINDIAYVGSTPQGRVLDGNNNVTMLSTDNRHQIFTSTSGFTITLPSTGIKAGERFVFEWSNPTLTSTFTINASDNSTILYASTGICRETFTALIDNPIASSDWQRKWIITQNQIYSGFGSPTLTTVANTRKEVTSSTLITLNPGIWHLGFSASLILSSGSLSNETVMGLRNSSGLLAMRSVNTIFANGYIDNVPITDGTTITVAGNSYNPFFFSPSSKSGLYRTQTYSDAIQGCISLRSSVSATHYFNIEAHAYFVAPINTNI